MSTNPFFSVLLPTYDRIAYLQQTVASVLAQTFADFELIVGNDYVEQPLTHGDLGSDDRRIRLLNHQKNLGELQNMRRLLDEAQGRYCLFIFDDDLCAPNLLEAAYAALQAHGFPPALLPGYRQIGRDDTPQNRPEPISSVESMAGRTFLRRYWSGSLTTMGHGGLYDAKYLRSFDGVDRLSDSRFAVYAEYLLLIRIGLLDRVVFIDAPLIHYRVHEGIRGSTSRELPLVREAGSNLLSRGATLLAQPPLADDFKENVAALIKLLLRDYVWKLKSGDSPQGRWHIVPYLFQMARRLKPLQGSAHYQQAVTLLLTIGINSLAPPALTRRVRNRRIQPQMQSAAAD